MKMKIKIIIRYILVLIAGLFLGWLLFGTKDSDLSTDEHEAKADHTTWTCSMHPQVRKSEPGKCPICGMDLVPLSSFDQVDNVSLHMTETAMKLANVQTSVVGYGYAPHEIRLTGKVVADERKVYSQPAHVSGRIERLLVNFTGEYVKRGQTVATLYSPELMTAREELIQAYKIKDTQPGLYNAAREKLKNWRLSEKQIEDLLNSQSQTIFPVLADVSGIVVNKRVNQGDYVERGKSLYDVADLSHVWVLFDLYEVDMQWIKRGDRVEFTVLSLPGETFEGNISFVDPVVSTQTRTAAARIEIKNPGEKLKPQMLVSGVVKSTSREKHDLIVPKSSVLWTGERSIVYVKTSSINGVDFTLREITLGSATGNGYVVRDGLKEGEEIVTHGTFSVDAAAQLAGKPSMMSYTSEPLAEGAMTGLEMKREAALSKEDWGAVFLVYFGLKDALVADDVPVVLLKVKELNATVKKLVTEGASPASRGLLNLSEKMLGTEKIEKIRAYFVSLSEKMIVIAKERNMNSEDYYVLHCPMADSNRGADWLSKEKEIRNPYFGSAMLSCGEVKEVIKK